MGGHKNWIEIVLMPVVIAFVGIIGTHLVTKQQANNAKTMSIAQTESAREMAAADRQIKVLEIFSDKVTSSNENDRILALRLLKAVDGDLAEKLATAVLESETEESSVRKVADEVAEEAGARARLLPRVYIHIRSEEDRPVAAKLTRALKGHNYVVPGIARLVDSGPHSTQLRYFRPEEESEAQSIVDLLRAEGLKVDLRYLSGYEHSIAIRPNHFELWLSPGAT